MYITRLSGGGLTDITILIQKPDFVPYNDPQGIASWNGIGWQWIRRFDKDHIIEIMQDKGSLWILHRNGALSQLTQGVLHDFRIPVNDTIFVNDFMVSSAGDISIVGDKGLIAQWERGVWTTRFHEVEDDFICLLECQDAVIVGGAKGSVYLLAGQRLQRIDLDFKGVITRLAQGPGPLIFGTGYDYQSRTGLLFAFDYQTRAITLSASAPSGLSGVAVVSETEVYVSCPAQGIYLWDGSRLKESYLEDGKELYQVGSSGFAVGKKWAF